MRSVLIRTTTAQVTIEPVSENPAQEPNPRRYREAFSFQTKTPLRSRNFLYFGVSHHPFDLFAREASTRMF